MNDNGRPWAAMTYPEMPTHLTPEGTARRAKVRIGVRVAKITLPLMLAAGLAALAGTGGGDDSGPSPTPYYSGDKIAFAVRLQLQSHGLLDRKVRVDCDRSTLAVGSVSSCGEFTDFNAGPSFDVRFVDTHGGFTFTAPNGRVLSGRLVA